MYKKPWKQEKHISNLIRFFIFSNSIFWSSHTIPIILYSNNIFCKKLSIFFDHFQHSIFLITAFYSKWSHSFFLFNIRKYIFLKKMNKTLTFNFFNFLLQIKYHLIFLQRNKIENFSFLYFFLGIQLFKQVRINFLEF